MSASKGFILVVEDIAAVRELVEVQLSLRGHSVRTARDGQDALDVIAAEGVPALVVSDILMPRMDGFVLAHRLRREASTAQVPIIFLSATYVSAEDERFALTLGALRFLAKPVDTDELFKAVTEALNGHTVAGVLLTEREFYTGYRQRLETKLRQKSEQVTRSRQQSASLPPGQRENYERTLADAQNQYDEIQRELAVLNTVLQGLK
ncbi:MAG: response regulator [Anaerolineales bacterium]